jgi:ribonuclease HI
LPLFKTLPFDFVVNTDGGARNNPGPAGIGAVFKNPSTGKIAYKIKKFIGNTTNNCAEYVAVLESLKLAKQLKAKRIKIRSDSELLVRQMQGRYQVKDEKLKMLHTRVKNISKEFELISYEHVRREENKEADSLVNQAINEKLKINPR